MSKNSIAQNSNEKNREYAQFIITWIIRIIFVAELIVSIVFLNLDSIVPASLGTFFIFLPIFIPKIANFKIIPEVHLLFAIFLFASLYLGEIQMYYESIWWWDSMLHLMSALMLGFLGFSLVYYFNNADHLNVSLSPFFIALFALSFAVMCGVIWEICEFASDQLLGTNTQKSGLIDTMWDLIMDTVGGLLAAMAGYAYLKKGRESLFMKITMKLIIKNNCVRPTVVKLKETIDRFKNKKSTSNSK